MRNKRFDPFSAGTISGIGPDINQQMVLRYPQTRLPGQTGFEISDGFALGTNPFGGGGVMDGLAGRYGLWGGLGGLIGVGLGKLFGKK
jgi:hypothetical protein